MIHWNAFAPIDPLQMIINFLTAVETPLKVIATLLAVIVVILVIIKAIALAHSATGLNVWALVLSLVGITMLWFIVYNIRDVMCWILTSMGQGAYCP